MKRLLALAVLANLASPGLVAPAMAQTQACDAGIAAFAAARAADLPTLVARYDALSGLGCAEQALYCAGQSVALRHLEEGYALANAGASTGQIKAQVEAGIPYGAPWQLLTGMADLTLAEARETQTPTAFGGAARYFQDALNVITEGSLCREVRDPETRDIASIHQRMTEALLLAPTLELAPTSRGECGGIFLEAIRGFTPEFRPLPIAFEFDQDRFTASGQKAAEVLLTCLKQKAPDEVIFSGHTDPKGTDAYNLALSERRLVAVAGYLKAGGYQGSIVLIPKGESEPFEADDPGLYTEAELDQMNRRVVLRSKVE